jgi:2-aminoadipate transaminase
MRLNFAGVPDAEIREGVRRIGSALREQVGLLGTLTGSTSSPRRAEPAPAAEEAPDGVPGLADVVALPRRDQKGSARRRQDR